MSLVVATSTQTTPADAASHTVTKPTGTVDGDLLIVCGSVDQDGSGATLTAPGGWTSVHNGGSGGGPPGQAGFFRVWTKTAAGEPASWSFGSSAAANSQFTALRVTGPGSGTATVTATATGGSTTPAPLHTAPSVTGVAGDLAIWGWQIIAEGSASTLLVASPMAQHGPTGSVSGTWLRHLVASQPLSSSDPTGARLMRTSLTPATWGDTTWGLVVHSSTTALADVVGKLEVEFVPGSGVYTDISDRVKSWTVNRPRPGLAQPVAVTTLTAELDNAPDSSGFCPFTPDSPVGAYWPNIERDRRVRGTALAGSSSWVRFHGWADTWVPDMSSGDVRDSTVTLTASCVLSRYARRKVLSYFGETVLASTIMDYWPFDDPTDSATVRGLSGDPVTNPGRPGLVIAPSRPPGSATLSPPDGGHLMDGQIEFSRGNDNAPAPVVLIPLRPGATLAAIHASYRLSTDPAGLTDDILAGYDINGQRLWRWCASLSGGNITWTLFDDADVAKSFWATNAPRDDAWHFWHLAFTSATGTVILLTEKGGLQQVLGSFAWTYDPRPTAWLVVGGQMVPARKGKQTNTFQGAVSSLAVRYTSGPTISYSEWAVPGVTSDADRVALFLNAEGAALGTAITPLSGSDNRPVMYTNATKNLLDRWNEHAITVAGHLSTLPDGRRRFITSENARPIVVALTLDAEADLDIPAGGWQAIKDERPTRVTGVGPAGASEVIDTATETSTGLRLDGPDLQTSAGTVAGARAVAASVMAPRLARLNAFGLDLSVTATDKVAAVMALTQSDRVRVTGLPAAYLGLTYQDVYASGWSETYVGQTRSAVFTFDADTADDPPEARLDDAEYGRTAIGDGNATITGGTCVGTTGTGTVIITSTSPLSTAAGDYPCDLDWYGERITVSAPGGATSPQTLTVTARGVAPTVARVHAAGQPVEVWHAACLAP